MFERAYGKTEEKPVEQTEQAAAETAATEETKAEETIVEEQPKESEKPVDETPAVSETVPTETTPEVSLLKDLGFESVDQLKAALNKQPEVHQPEFTNETSKKVYEALLAGQEDEIAEVLYTKKQLKSLEGENDPEKVIKAFIRFQNPEFNESEVNDEYKETYSLPEDAEFDESKKIREEKKLNQRIQKDVKAAKEYFSKLSEEIKLPTFQQEQAAQEEDNTDEQLAVYRQKFKDGISTLQAVPPIEFTHEVEFDGKKVSIPIRYELDEKGLNAVKTELLQDGGYDNLLTRRHYGDGNYKHGNIAADFYVLENFSKILDSVASQAVNKARIEWLKTQKNISDEAPAERALPEDLQKNTEKDALRQLFFK